MPCTWIASDLQLLLLLTLFLVAECISARMEGSVTSNNTMQQMVKENCSLASIITSSTARKQSTVTPPSEGNSAVPPEVTLVQSKDGTAVCKAAAGKPAAQISWTPERACTTVQEPWGNGTVTVQSTCHWEGHHVQNVSCSVSHLTGNKSLTIQLNQGTRIEHLRILYITSPVFIVLVIVGSIWLLKIHGCRKCKLKKTEPTPVVEEDEMQPYASYTEKNNPLYDTTNRVKTSQVSQS
uniref:Cell surface glycoprotein CD200 receptor 1 n=1 Tax=Camelus bactrianus TaxID=9837 RepID=A0A9W3H943_CAMBA|nr:cell surface glycoprotein CD200 receptor 1 [Camelus bactrianus]